jgi:hypothetical protein
MFFKVERWSLGEFGLRVAGYTIGYEGGREPMDVTIAVSALETVSRVDGLAFVGWPDGDHPRQCVALKVSGNGQLFICDMGGDAHAIYGTLSRAVLTGKVQTDRDA